MDSEEFRNFGKAAIDYIADYVDSIRDKSVLPDVRPKYLYDKISQEIPENGEKWQTILEDFDKLIMPGITHWQSPNFHAFFPCGSSFPSMVGDFMSAGLGILGIHWLSSPACTELEVMMMNWMGKMLGLPKEFLNCTSGSGGGVLEGSASESTLLCLFAAKKRYISRTTKFRTSNVPENEINGKLVAYTADQANSSVEKAAIMTGTQIRILRTNENGQLTGEVLSNAFQEDIRNNLMPCYVIATCGTTGICTFDRLNELGPICNEYGVWLHVDAAYAGAALILPEFRYLFNGLSYADSFCFNPHKWFLINFDCSALWVKNSNELLDTLSIKRMYLDSNTEDIDVPEYRNWQISIGRRFRSLKVWFTLRTYGLKGLQDHLRKQIGLAQLFACLVQQDERFEIVIPVSMGLVCFRLKGDNKLTEELHAKLTSRRNIYMITATTNTRLVLRFVVCSRLTEEQDIHYAWNEIVCQTNEIFAASQTKYTNGYLTSNNVNELSN